MIPVFSSQPQVKTDRADSSPVVCMPCLSLVVLLQLWFSGRPAAAVYYDTLPFYLRGLCRVLKVSPGALAALIGKLLRLPVRPVPHGDQIPAYPRLHLHSLETASLVAYRLKEQLDAEPGVRRLGKIIGREPALAFAVNYVADRYLYPQLLPLILCAHACAGQGRLLMVWNQACPGTWYDSVRQELPGISFDFWRWPTWYHRLYTVWVSLLVIFAWPLLTLHWILRRGVGSPPECRRYEAMTEFVDPSRLKGTAYDADYWVDGQRLTPGNTLFFLTHLQTRILAAKGHDPEEIARLVRRKGYHLAVLDELPYSKKFLSRMGLLYLGSFNLLSPKGSPTGARVFLAGWREVLEFAPLFDHFWARNCIYLTYPNGLSGFRENDAVVTGLCRVHGVRSVGCQMRTVYANKYHDCFDCYDLYLSWGPAWHASFPQRMEFVRETATVGCIYLDTALPRYRQCRESGASAAKAQGMLVSIFPSDIDDKHHYTFAYTLRFLLGCAKLAAQYPQVRFIVKTKHPEHLEILKKDEGFRRVSGLVRGNFEFVKQSQFEYVSLLQISDVVIAIGFTTPGAEALLLGKRAIYYSELGGGGQAFAHLPHFIAKSPEELNQLFALAVKDYRDYSQVFSGEISRLDPYRDGQALTRINNILVGQ